MPMAPKTRKPRPQSARLDVLAMMMGGGKNDKRPASPADSLSPCREDYIRGDKEEIPRSAGHDDINTNTADTNSGPDEDDWFQSEPASAGLTNEAGTPSAQTTSQQEPAHRHVPSLPKHSTTPAAASHTSLPGACEPRCLLSRAHRPSTISVDETSGSSTLPAYELKQAIREASSSRQTPQTSPCTPPPSSPERGRRRHRRSPALLHGSSDDSMGNSQSHHDLTDSGVLEDDRSAHSVLRASRLKAARLPRRSSMNIFKRLDSKYPLPTELSATVIEVPRAATAPNLDGMVDDDETEDGEQERSRARHAHRHSAPSPSMPMQTASSTVTLTEESAARPLSASDTITDRRTNTQTDDYVDEDDEEESPSHLRVSALSPTLPAPSPIPEDSPHKYGLKDRMDTPEGNSPPPPQDTGLANARRRSSGFAIFNEAKTLQSAQSFLNGLSTARRRAESRAQSRNATDNSQETASTVITSYHSGHRLGGHVGMYENHPSLNPNRLSASVTASTIHPYNSVSHTALPHMATDADLDLNIDITNRNLGHPFKSSGYAYAPAMSLTQIKCYRSHNRLLPSRNKNAPVECAVCHADDENQHWSCGWCALRMCGGCRKVLEAAGVAGLRERVRAGEMGNYY